MARGTSATTRNYREHGTLPGNSSTHNDNRARECVYYKHASSKPDTQYPNYTVLHINLLSHGVPIFCWCTVPYRTWEFESLKKSTTPHYTARRGHSSSFQRSKNLSALHPLHLSFGPLLFCIIPGQQSGHSFRCKDPSRSPKNSTQSSFSIRAQSATMASSFSEIFERMACCAAQPEDYANMVIDDDDDIVLQPRSRQAQSSPVGSPLQDLPPTALSPSRRDMEQLSQREKTSFSESTTTVSSTQTDEDERFNEIRSNATTQVVSHRRGQKNVLLSTTLISAKNQVSKARRSKAG